MDRLDRLCDSVLTALMIGTGIMLVGAGITHMFTITVTDAAQPKDYTEGTEQA